MALTQIMITPAELEIHLKGVTFYERAIRKNLGARRIVFKCEPNNPYDANAVAGYVNGKAIGHIPKEMDQLYGKLITEFERRGLEIEWDAELGEFETQEGNEGIYVRFMSPTLELVAQTIEEADSFVERARAALSG
jgi:hypothetical protein